jgi:hypothetical protein
MTSKAGADELMQDFVHPPIQEFTQASFRVWLT